MLNHAKIRIAVKLVSFLMGVFLVGAEVVTVTNSVSATPSRGGMVHPLIEVPMATSGNNVYMAWVNNDTGYCNVFFGKSTDGGKSLKTTIISAPNKGHVIDQDTQISASGNNVYVTWWTNKTGTLMPVFKASNDNGDTFGKTIMLNSTASP
jgi:hypothetical protein